jgi:quinol monooxygenase YgiN
MLATPDLALDQPCRFKHSDVARHPGKGHGQRSRKIGNARLAIAQRDQQRPPGPHYQVNPGAVDKVKAAIVEFVKYVTEHEPGTRIYTAWQQDSDPTKFVHLFEFADEAAHQAHGTSAAVRKFEEAYQPELAAGPVVFTDYLQIASNRSR